jgi:hypothetical protein
MNQWELDSNVAARAVRKSNDPMSYVSEARNALERIFESFCTSRERKYGRILNISFRRPPEYNPKTELVIKVETVRPGRTFVETERAPGLGGGLYKYVVVMEDGKWRIDNLKHLDGEKWVQWIL